MQCCCQDLFRSRDQDRDLDKMNSNLETMLSRSQHWLHRFQLVTEHSLKGATNYGNCATGVDTKHAVLRLRSRLWTSGFETKTETWTKWTRVHSSLETMVSRSHDCTNAIINHLRIRHCTRVASESSVQSEQRNNCQAGSCRTRTSKLFRLFIIQISVKRLHFSPKWKLM